MCRLSHFNPLLFYFCLNYFHISLRWKEIGWIFFFSHSNIIFGFFFYDNLKTTTWSVSLLSKLHGLSVFTKTKDKNSVEASATTCFRRWVYTVAWTSQPYKVSNSVHFALTHLHTKEPKLHSFIRRNHHCHDPSKLSPPPPPPLKHLRQQLRLPTKRVILFFSFRFGSGFTAMKLIGMETVVVGGKPQWKATIDFKWIKDNKEAVAANIRNRNSHANLDLVLHLYDSMFHLQKVMFLLFNLSLLFSS